MRMTRLKHILLCIVLLTSGLCATDQTERKVAHSEEPDYPELARKMNLHGAVKLKIWISPDGTVRRLEYVGGHPVLAEAALKAVRGWHYEAATKESNAIVVLRF
jgi:TonB family protein